MTSRKDIVIFGVSSFAEIAVEYFTRDTDYRVVALVVDEEFHTDDSAFGLPVVVSEDFLRDPAVHLLGFHVAVTYRECNGLRAKKIADFSRCGLQPVSYLSPHAYIDSTARIGPHAFIFENNTIQPFVRIGAGVVMWSGNHIGHHSTIGDNVFVSSHVVISGHCEVGERSFLGVNSTLGNNVHLGAGNWLLPNSLVLSDTSEDSMWKPPRTERASSKPSEMGH